MLYYYLFFLPTLGWIVYLLSLRTALENLYPSKVWVAVGNIFQTVFQGSYQWPTTKVFVLYFIES